VKSGSATESIFRRCFVFRADETAFGPAAGQALLHRATLAAASRQNISGAETPHRPHVESGRPMSICG
jgi:hypothetical protein